MADQSTRTCNDVSIEDNFYRSKNQQMFDKLIDLRSKSKSHFIKKLSLDVELLSWINEQLPMLEDGSYSLKTKCYWILTGRLDFPTCKVCGSKFGIRMNVKFPKGYKNTCSSECANKLDGMSCKKHFIEEYGVENPFLLPEVIERIQLTKLDRHGSAGYNNREKARLTFIDHYGVDNNMKTERGKEMYKESMQKNHGVDWPLQADECKANMKNTVLTRYHVQHISLLKSTKDKTKKTCNELYGVDWPLLNPEIRKKAQCRYAYDGKKFDSMPELAYFIWLVDHLVEFTYQPNVAFHYTFNGKKKTYCPDFIVDGKTVEVKGNHFFKDDDPSKEMINPFDRSLDELYEAKHQCMMLNDVMILTEKDYRKYIDYCISKFQSKEWHLDYKNNEKTE